VYVDVGNFQPSSVTTPTSLQHKAVVKPPPICRKTITEIQNEPPTDLKPESQQKTAVPQTEMTNHNRKVEKIFLCQKCDKRFQCRYELLAHGSSHIATTTIHCPLCQKSFSRFYLLQNHLRWHTGEMALTCKSCGGRFQNLILLQEHLLNCRMRSTEQGLSN